MVGLLAARWLGKLLDGWLNRKAMEPPMRMLVVRIVKLLIFAVALVIALGTAGMDVMVLLLRQLNISILLCSISDIGMFEIALYMSRSLQKSSHE